MSKLKSIFGAYAENMQLMIDRSQDRFAPTWFQTRFPFAPSQVALNFTSVIGASRIEAAASVVSRDSETPLRSRANLSKLTGEIPAIKEMFKMSESDYRDYMVMQAMPVSDTTKRDQMLDFIFNDVMKVGNSVFKRVDYMVLEGLSTGQISLTTINNPDGLVLGTAVDLLMPTGNRANSAVTWDTAASATPITDIETMLATITGLGRSVASILMSPDLFSKFRKAKEVVDTMTAYFYGPKPGTGFNPKAVTTLDSVNAYLTAEKLPTIELVDQTIGIESDGVISAKRPFSDNNAVFVPAGNLGVIKNAIAIEETQKVAGVSYAKFQQALISKFSSNEPFGEWTKAELNAFPAIDSIDNIFLLAAVHA